MHHVDILLMLGGAIAAVAVSVVCGLGLVVWLAGSNAPPPRH